MKVKLTKQLSGRYHGNVGDIIEIDPKDLEAIVRQGAGMVLKEPPKDIPPKEEKEKDKKAR